jgi:ketosteroid isomerase-like protein
MTRSPGATPFDTATNGLLDASSTDAVMRLYAEDGVFIPHIISLRYKVPQALQTS